MASTFGDELPEKERDPEDAPVIIDPGSSAIDSLAQSLERSEGLTRVEAYQEATRRLTPDLYYADPSRPGYALTPEGMADIKARQALEERGLPSPDEPTVRERGISEARGLAGEAVEETDGDLGEAIRRGLITEAELETAAQDDGIRVRDPETGEIRPMTTADITAAGYAEGTRVIDELRAARIAQTLRDITPARYADGQYNLERALELASAGELIEAGFNPEAVERAQLRQESAREIAGGLEALGRDVGAYEPPPRPIGADVEPEGPPLTMQTAARLAQYGRSEEAQELAQALQEEYQGRLSPGRVNQLIIDVVPLAWLTRWDQLSPGERALYATGDALLVLGPVVGKGGMAAIRAAKPSNLKSVPGQLRRLNDSFRATYQATGRTAAQADEVFDALARLKAAQVRGTPSQVATEAATLARLAARNGDDATMAYAIRLRDLNRLWSQRIVDYPVAGASPTAVGAIRPKPPTRAQVLDLNEVADRIAREASVRELLDLPRALPPSGPGSLGRAQGVSPTGGGPRYAPTIPEGAPIPLPARPEAIIRPVESYLAGRSVAALSEQIATVEADLERAQVAGLGPESARVQALEAQLADLTAQRAEAEVEGELVVAAPQVTTIERDVLTDRALTEYAPIPETRGIEEQVRDDLERAKGVTPVSIEEQVRVDLERAKGVPPVSIEEQVRVDLERAKGVPSVSIEEQVRVDLEMGRASSTDMADLIRADLEAARMDEVRPFYRPATLADPFGELTPTPDDEPEPPATRLDLPTPTPARDLRIDEPTAPPRGTARPPRQPRKGKRAGSKGPAPALAEWVGHRQGFVYRYKNLRTGAEVASLTPIYGKVPPALGRGSARKSARVVRTGPVKGTQLVDNMGVMRVEYTPEGRITFKRVQKGKKSPVDQEGRGR